MADKLESPRNYSKLKHKYRVSEICLHYKFKVPYGDRIQVNSSSIAYEVLKYSWNENKIELIEQSKILLLDNTNHCQGILDLSTGGINGCLIDSRLLFAAALKAKSNAIILAHNHPSGAPSKRISVIYKAERQQVSVSGVDTVVKGAGNPIKTYGCLKPP